MSNPYWLLENDECGVESNGPLSFGARQSEIGGSLAKLGTLAAARWVTGVVSALLPARHYSIGGAVPREAGQR